MRRVAKISSLLTLVVVLGIAGCAKEKMMRGGGGGASADSDAGEGVVADAGAGAGTGADEGDGTVVGAGDGSGVTILQPGGTAAVVDEPRVLTAEEVEEVEEVLEEATGVSPESTLKYFNESVGNKVFFAFDRHNLTAESREVLRRQALWLTINPAARIVIEGHCDERGTRSYNLALGARRAQSVKQYLVGAGIFPNRISSVSFGKERPASLCSNESCWKANRRGVTVVDGVPDS